MPSGHPLGVCTFRGDRGDAERRGVGRQDALRAHRGLESAEQLLLGLQLFDDGLDHQIAGAELAQVVGGPDAGECRVRIRLRQLALDNSLFEVVTNRGQTTRYRGLDVVEQLYRAARCGAHLRNATSHGACTNDAHSLYLLPHSPLQWSVPGRNKDAGELLVARPEGNPLLGFQNAWRRFCRAMLVTRTVRGGDRLGGGVPRRTSATCRTRASGRHVLEPAAAVDDQVLAGDVGGQV